MISLLIVSGLDHLESFDFFEEWVRPFFFKKSFGPLEHAFTKRALKYDFVTPSVSIMQVMVDFSELSIHIETFEVNELIFYVSDSEVGLKSVANFV